MCTIYMMYFHLGLWPLKFFTLSLYHFFLCPTRKQIKQVFVIIWPYLDWSWNWGGVCRLLRKITFAMQQQEKTAFCISWKNKFVGLCINVVQQVDTFQWRINSIHVQLFSQYIAQCTVEFNFLKSFFKSKFSSGI